MTIVSKDQNHVTFEDGKTIYTHEIQEYCELIGLEKSEIPNNEDDEWLTQLAMCFPFVEIIDTIDTERFGLVKYLKVAHFKIQAVSMDDVFEWVSTKRQSEIKRRMELIEGYTYQDSLIDTVDMYFRDSITIFAMWNL